MMNAGNLLSLSLHKPIPTLQSICLHPINNHWTEPHQNMEEKMSLLPILHKFN